MWEIAHSKFDMVKILNVHLFVDFIYSEASYEIFAPIQNFSLCGNIIVSNLEELLSDIDLVLYLVFMVFTCLIVLGYCYIST